MNQHEITYSEIQSFQKEDLQDLFLSINWESGNFPEKLHSALEHSDKVISAWDSKRLVGLMNAITDGSMVAYFHYLLVRPEYQRLGIGKHLVASMLDAYKHIRLKTLISYDHQIAFYQSLGFRVSDNVTSMSFRDHTLPLET